MSIYRKSKQHQVTIHVLLPHLSELTEYKCPDTPNLMLSDPAAFTQIQTRLPLTPREALNSLKMLLFLINCKDEKRQSRNKLTVGL